MPLGLDTPSTFGMAFAVIGPLYLETKDAHLTWQVATAVIVLMGLFKIAASFFGPALRRAVPRAGLLGSIAAVALLLIAYLPMLRLFSSPVVGFLSLGVVLAALIARIEPAVAHPRRPGRDRLRDGHRLLAAGVAGLLPAGQHSHLPSP